MCSHECMAGEPCESLETCLEQSRVASIDEANQINTELTTTQCSFCGRDKAVAGRLIIGNRGAAICARCAEELVELFWDYEREEGAEAVG